MPLTLLLWQTFTLYPNDYSFNNLTVLFWISKGDAQFAEGEAGILRNTAILRAAWNSIRLALISSATAGFLGIFIGYAVVKGRNTRLANSVEQISFLPYLVPGIAFGALYLSLFTHRIGPFPALYGIFFLVALVCIAKNLPFTGRAGISSMLQIGNELEEASEVTGARWFRRFRKIILPLSIKGSLSGFLLVFIMMMKELALIILLVTPETRTLTTMTFRYQEQGYVQFSSAISVLIIFIVLAGNLITKKIMVSLLQKRKDNTLEARIQTILPTGAETVIQARHFDSESREVTFNILLTREEEWKVGQEVFLYIPPEEILLFDGDTGRLISPEI